MSFAAFLDYFLTFYLASGIDIILEYEYSPTLLFALKHNILIPYIVVTMIFYFFAGRFILKQLADSDIYWVGALVICSISLTHVLGGISWYVLNESYSNLVFLMSRFSVVVSIIALSYVLIVQKNA
ncbi:hypothetical protein J2755_000361 [Methanohalophilus levihalophilus]|uniref:hypothetical protein n=1 Tax=Methanohalophilus levihalophilus TaxID=1431282 RepID=UPI001AE19925|nr:hypothetical protein [Methanohalophilus levihalophilus]MBP2029441.1 hypothetical protein [Methanohalophilus levihalophilus]